MINLDHEPPEWAKSYQYVTSNPEAVMSESTRIITHLGGGKFKGTRTGETKVWHQGKVVSCGMIYYHKTGKSIKIPMVVALFLRPIIIFKRKIILALRKKIFFLHL